jgi:multiple sugar transport system ATP-binding protein
MAELKLNHIKKSYGQVGILNGVSMQIDDGEFVVFVGPSGCGKSTLLRIIAGLEDITEGVLEIDGKQANHLRPVERGIAMVFQSYALYPHMTVAENMGFSLKQRKISKQEINLIVADVAKTLQIDHLLSRRPKELSGGQRQRVAIGRSLVREPSIFLFDEPLSNLDAALRGDMRIELKNLHKKLGTTMIYVTHDQVEAMTMADRIVVLNGGRVEQVGTPREIYGKPENLFVAEFMGSPKINILSCQQQESKGGKLQLIFASGDTLIYELDAESKFDPAQIAQIGVRPEDLIVSLDCDLDNSLRGRLVNTEDLGGEILLHVDCGFKDNLICKTDYQTKLTEGCTVSLLPKQKGIHLFNINGERI